MCYGGGFEKALKKWSFTCCVTCCFKKWTERCDKYIMCRGSYLEKKCNLKRVVLKLIRNELYVFKKFQIR